MKSILSALLILTASLATIPTAGTAQEACSLYRIQQGDTLREIAESAYGTDDFRPIWRANQSEIGRNPNIISVGTVLSLPCPDGAMPSETPQANTAPAGEARFSFVTANGYLPYTDESLDQRGLVTHLVRMAMLRAAPEAPIEIVFVNDWSAHLEVLLPRQTFDASFPWTRPGCETQGKLTQTELYACQNFLYSDPFYEIVDGFFSRKGSGLENVIAFDGLAGPHNLPARRLSHRPSRRKRPDATRRHAGSTRPDPRLFQPSDGRQGRSGRPRHPHRRIRYARPQSLVRSH